MTQPPPPDLHTPGGASDGPDPKSDGPDPESDPTRGDRRTLIIGATTMIALVFAGVIASVVFTTSPCDALEPDLLSAPATSADPAAVLGDLTGGAGNGPSAADLQSALDGLAGVLGPVMSVADVTGATSLTVGADSPVAVGPTITMLDPATSTSLQAQVGTEHVVGDGTALYTLDVGNELTGQVDALRAIDAQFEPSACIDTATMGSPLAFLLDANDGELLLLRIDDDASDGYLELRDAVDGRLWMGEVEYETSQPGVVGERLTAVAGPSTVVVGTFSSPGSEVPPIQALDRADAEPRWVLDRDHLEDVGVLRTDAPERVEVVAANEQVVVARISTPAPDVASDAEAEVTNGDTVPDADDDAGVGAGPSAAADGRGDADPGETRDAGKLVVVGIADGAVLWHAPIEAGQPFQGVSQDGITVWLVLDDGEVVGSEVVVDGEAVDPDAARASVAHGGRGRVVQSDAGVLAATRGSLVVESGGQPQTMGAPFEVQDVIVDPTGAITLLLGIPTQDAAVAATFAGTF